MSIDAPKFVKLSKLKGELSKHPTTDIEYCKHFVDGRLKHGARSDPKVTVQDFLDDYDESFHESVIVSCKACGPIKNVTHAEGGLVLNGELLTSEEAALVRI